MDVADAWDAALNELGVLGPDQAGDPVRHVAIDSLNDGRPGSFMKHLLLAFSKADPENFDLLRPIVYAKLKQYGYKCTCREKKVEI